MNTRLLHNITNIFTILMLFLSLGCHQVQAHQSSMEAPLWGFALDGYPITLEKLQAVKKKTGLNASVIVFFLQWPSPEKQNTAKFPCETLEAIYQEGSIPCLTWEPMYYEGVTEIMISHHAIMAGQYDSYITEFARQAKSYGRPLMIRFAHEMNIERYHWGTEKADYGPQSPAVYKKIFYYVVNIFRNMDVKNALWVFCPNAESVPNTSYDPTASWNCVANFYPGDDYVDIVGMDGYNWGTTQTIEKDSWESQWKSFENIFRNAQAELATIAPGKPVIIFETASVTQGGNKNQWISEALVTARQWGLRGIVWFQVKKKLDWRINSDNDIEYIDSVRNNSSRSHDWIRSLTR